MKAVSKYLYTHGQDDPDLIIRTAGEKRLSNFYFGSPPTVNSTLLRKVGGLHRNDLVEALNYFKSIKENMDL